MWRTRVAFALAFVLLLAAAAPAAAAKPPKSDGEYCYEVSFTSEIPVRRPDKSRCRDSSSAQIAGSMLS